MYDEYSLYQKTDLQQVLYHQFNTFVNSWSISIDTYLYERLLLVYFNTVFTFLVNWYRYLFI